MSENLTRCSCRGNNGECSYCCGSGYIQDVDPNSQPALIRSTLPKPSSGKTVKSVQSTLLKHPKPSKPKPMRFNDALVSITAGTPREPKAKTLLKLMHMMEVASKARDKAGIRNKNVRDALWVKFTNAITMERPKFFFMFDTLMNMIFNAKVVPDINKRVHFFNDAMVKGKVNFRLGFNDVDVLCQRYDIYRSVRTANPVADPAQSIIFGKKGKKWFRDVNGNVVTDVSPRTTKSQMISDVRTAPKPRVLNDGKPAKPRKSEPKEIDGFISIIGQLDDYDFTTIRKWVGARNFRFLYADGSKSAFRKLKEEFPNSRIVHVTQEGNARSLRASPAIDLIKVGRHTE